MARGIYSRKVPKLNEIPPGRVIRSIRLHESLLDRCGGRDNRNMMCNSAILCRVGLGIFLLFGLSAPTFADDNLADASSPKAAVKSLYSAVDRGDAAAVMQLIIIDGDAEPQRELTHAYAD